MSIKTSENNRIELFGDVFVPYVSEEQIQERITEIASRMNKDMAAMNPVFICVLNGAFMFFSDLVRRITVDCEVDFLRLSSYGEKKISSGDVTLVKDLNCDVENRHVVLVEDIVDTGHSIEFMKTWIRQKNPSSIKIVTLLHKPKSAKIHHDLDYVGFEIPSRFVVGFGLDYAQRARNLPAIYILDGEEKQSEEVSDKELK